MIEYHRQTQYTVSYILCDTHLHNYDRQNGHTLVKDDHIATALVTEVSAHRQQN